MPKTPDRVKRWHLANKDRVRVSAKEGKLRRLGLKYTKQELQEQWYEALKDAPCSDCGGRFPACCMDLDHRDPSEKLYCVGAMVAHHYNLDLCKAEAAKCDLVCSNCHRIRTRNARIAKFAKLRELRATERSAYVDRRTLPRVRSMAEDPSLTK